MQKLRHQYDVANKYVFKWLHITNAKVNSAFHPSGVGKSSTGLHDWG